MRTGPGEGAGPLFVISLCGQAGRCFPALRSLVQSASHALRTSGTPPEPGANAAAAEGGCPRRGL